MQNREIPPTERVTVRRMPARAAYDRETINAILDAGFLCHLGFALEAQPYVIPTLYARAGDQVLIHGSAASRMLRTLRSGAPVCVTVTIVDGLVLARSAYHHSMNYRSVVILGEASEITATDAKLDALHRFMERIIPGRWNEVRPPSQSELKATTVFSIPLTEASAKVRSGPPGDDEEDYALPVWAGEIPFRMIAAPPRPDPRVPQGTAEPLHLKEYYLLREKEPG
jgi:nitroimidazol reductase NimA-like FMN-containing flavoprotein (pyridoxamine 5'-phosphate oxidase superfamily)